MQTIPEKEINVLKRMTGQMEEISVYSARHFKLEDEVEVSGGHLHGLSGYIIEIESKKCLVMQLTNIGFQMRIHINPKHLKKVDTLVV